MLKDVVDWQGTRIRDDGPRKDGTSAWICAESEDHCRSGEENSSLGVKRRKSRTGCNLFLSSPNSDKGQPGADTSGVEMLPRKEGRLW